MTGCIETPRGTSHCSLGLCRIVAEEFEITEQDCTLYLRQICRGVEYLHKAECHLNGRNFRSRNISIGSRCSGRVIHLTSPISHFTVFNSHQIIFPLKAKHFTFGFESKIYLLIPYTLNSLLQPENMVCVGTNSNTIKIIDFGTAKIVKVTSKNEKWKT